MARDSIRLEKEFWSDKFMDLANVMFGFLVVGQFVTDKLRWGSVVLGIVAYVVIAVICRKLRR
jgi:hypothetical protein